jgi:hypothetical protein
MSYTTQGMMTPADIADHEALTDTGRNPECPGHEEAEFGVSWNGTVYCSRAENCPDVEDVPEGECPGTPHRGHARKSEPCPLNDDDQ